MNVKQAATTAPPCRHHRLDDRTTFDETLHFRLETLEFGEQHFRLRRNRRPVGLATFLRSLFQFQGTSARLVGMKDGEQAFQGVRIDAQGRCVSLAEPLGNAPGVLISFADQHPRHGQQQLYVAQIGQRGGQVQGDFGSAR